MTKLATIRKFLVALLGAAAVIAVEIPSSAPSWLTGGAAVVTALAVWLVPNARTVASRQNLAGRVGTRAVLPEDRRPFEGP